MVNVWTREETLVAFWVYCQIPFKDSSKFHPLIREYAGYIGRTPSALNMKVGNIGRLDPSLMQQGIVGLGHGSKVEVKIWNEFNTDPERVIAEGEAIIERLKKSNVSVAEIANEWSCIKGTEKEVVVRRRVNQRFFRAAVLSSYNNRCCVTGLSNPKLLEACHIVGWTDDESNRLNPSNGLCMNTLFHRAYDEFLMSVSPDYKIAISDAMLVGLTEEKELRNYLVQLRGAKMLLPAKFLPQREFLDVHHSQYLKRV